MRLYKKILLVFGALPPLEYDKNEVVIHDVTSE